MFGRSVHELTRIGRKRCRLRPRRLAPCLLAACLTLTLLPAAALAENGGELCVNHQAHTEDCGYVQAREGQPCGHGENHTEACYTSTLVCGLEEGAVDENGEPHAHTQECCALECPHLQDRHDDLCGYAPTVEGRPCGHVCALCGTDENNLTVTVTAFDAVADQTVPAGTVLDALELPSTLNATGFSIAGDPASLPEPAAITVENVQWTPDRVYEGAAGGYLFTAFADGYVLAEGVNWPSLTVTVAEPAPLSYEAVVALFAALPAPESVAGMSGEEKERLSVQLDEAATALEALSPADYQRFMTGHTAYLQQTKALQDALTGGAVLLTEVDTVDHLNTTISGSNGTAASPTVITIAASGISVDKAITIDSKHVKLTGGTLTRAESYQGKLIEVKNGGSLTLENITLDGNKDAVTATGSLVYVAGKFGKPNLVGTLSVKTDAILQNNHITGDDNGGGAIMLSDNGGAVSFTMTGGVIKDNTASSGGAINDNGWKATTIRITGGKITGNTANGSDADSTYGGGIYSNGTLIIEGGEITGNTTPNGRGGGIYKTGGSDKIFTVTGGVISGNTARTSEPGGDNVYVNQCAFTLGGAANIPDGLYLKLGGDNSTFAISSALEHPVEIEAIYGHPEIGDLVASGASGSSPYTITEDDLAKFSYADGLFSFTLANNQIKLAAPKPAAHAPTANNTHHFIYANGTPLLLVAGQPDSNTVIYIDADGNGAISDGETIFDPDGNANGMNDTTVGNDLSEYTIFGGSFDATIPDETKITMTGGKVCNIYGGSETGGSAISKASIAVTGGTVTNEIYGGGRDSAVADSKVTIGGNAVVGRISNVSGPLDGVVINGGTGTPVTNGVANFIIEPDLNGSVNVKLPAGYISGTIATSAAQTDAEKITLSGDGAAGNEAYFDMNSQTIMVRQAAAPTYWSDDGVRADAFAGGDGSASDPYRIATPAQLGYMAYCLKNDWDDYKDKAYKLGATIDLDDYQWAPMGSGSGAFMGTFDGGNFTIKSMRVNMEGDADTDRFAGLFAKIDSATVKNVTIDPGSSVTVDYTGNTTPLGYGGVVGHASFSSVIENCHNAAGVSASSTDTRLPVSVSGVVGYLEESTVKNCSNSGAVGGTFAYAGGVAGASDGTLQNSWNTGNIRMDGNYRDVGGIVGGNYHQGKVENCYNTGNISGSGRSSVFGGIAGKNDGLITNCHTTGAVNVTASGGRNWEGAYVGQNDGTVSNGYYLASAAAGLEAFGHATGTGTDVLSFGDGGVFTQGGSVSISGQPYSSLLSALNAWVTAQGDPAYWFWSNPAASPILTEDRPPDTNEEAPETPAGTFGPNSGSPNSGSPNSGSASSDNSSFTPPILGKKLSDNPNGPAAAQIPVTAKADGSGSAAVTVTSKALNKAIQKANKGGILQKSAPVQFNVRTGGKNVNAVKVNLPETTQKRLIDQRVPAFSVVIDHPDIAMTLHMDAVKEINRQANGDVQLTATRLTNTSGLSNAARTAISGRPVFSIKAAYDDGRKRIANLGEASMSIAIPYTLQNGETASGVCAVYVDENGQAVYLTDSVYDAAAKVLRFRVNGFSVYGIGYKAPGSTGITSRDGINTVPQDTEGRAVHTIAYGDTLWDIAVANNCTVDEIVELNAISNPNNVPVNTQIMIP